ncbi:tetratricopeptide repeat protein [Pelistega europaea]|uniref:Tetratricopeptide repeat protein n=1 Tax=Pelistega europaea TaxID=106147 RepID=A0A7Y4LBG8_9BURK|nr:tetratricopeptide repeat protein [Pelistega europaea]
MLSFKTWVCGVLLALSPTVWSQPVDVMRKPWLAEELKQSVDADEVYSILAIETAFFEENYAFAAKEALNFTKYHRVSPQIVEIAVNYYYTEGDYEHAYEAVKYWYRAYPDNDNVRTWYTTLLGQTGRDKEFLRALQQSLRNARPEALKDKLHSNALILEEIRDEHKALAFYEQMTAPFHLQSADYHVLFSDFAARAEKLDLAWKEAFKALEVDKNSEEAALRVLFLSQGGKREQGMRFVQQFLNKHPQSRNLYLNYISALTEDGEYNNAIKAIKRMQKVSPEDFDLLYFQALIHYDAQQWSDARRVLNQFIDIQQQRQKSLPKDSSTADEKLLDARKLLVSIYKAEKKYRLALTELNKIPDQDQDAELLMEKARLLTALGSVREGLSILDMASQAFPENRGGFLWLGGNLLNESGRTDEAIVYYNDALKELPNNADIKYALAILYDKRGEVWPAEKLLREVMREEPDLADAYNALGYIFADRNYNLEESQELLEKALMLDSANPYIMDSMGWLQFRLKNYDVALEYLERAFDEKPEAEIAAHLAEVYVAKGDQHKARETLKIGLQDDASNAVLRETIRRLNLGVK